MSRLIDTLPPPGHVREKKLIVTTKSRLVYLAARMLAQI